MNDLLEKARKAKEIAPQLGILPTEEKNAALAYIAEELVRQKASILEANQIDLERAKEQQISPALIDRLLLNEKRIGEMAEGVRQVCALPDPVGEILERWERPNGLRIEKVRVPLGVVGMIYEARPNVTVDAAALCLKTGNAVLLRGSSSALSSNRAIVRVIQEALRKTSILPEAVQLIEDTSRETADRMLKLNEYLDVLIPRGGAGLIRNVVENATVPVLETGVGNCHVYIDRDADYEMAEAITVNAKTSRPAVCNAAETLLVQKDWAEQHLLKLAYVLRDKGVELRGCERSVQLVPWMKRATEEDYYTEFLDYILAVKVVDNVDEAIQHINKYGTKHSEAIITENAEHARRFLQLVDAAAVYHNASTRFTDGFEFGFGAEIGISTQKLHARGPMGLPALTSSKYIIHGQGQVR